MSATHSEVAPETQHDTTTGTSDIDLKAGRRQVARSRGVLSGVLLIILGAWAALAPFIGPYFDFGIDPKSGDAWHWTSGRGLYELLPGAVTVLAGIVLLVSASRALTVLMSWLAALAGIWLVVGPTLDAVIKVGTGAPADGTGVNKTVALSLLYFLATGAVITLVAGIALGRLSVHSVRDVRAAERRAEAEAAAEAQRQEAERRENGRREAERQEYERREAEHRENQRLENERLEHERRENERVENERQANQPLAADGDDHRDHAPVDEAGDRRDDGAAATETDTSDYDRGFAAGQQARGADGHESTPTAGHDERYAAPAATPYGDGYQTAPADQSGAHPVDPAAPPAQGAPPAQAPPAQGGMDQYRYGTDNPDQHNR